MQIQTTGTVDSQTGVKVLVFGKSGVGKTRLAATCPNPIILSAESGLLSLKAENLPFIQIRTIAELTNCYNWFARYDNTSAHFHTIVIDSVSEIAETILRESKARNKDPRKAYGDVLDDTIAMVRNFRDLPYRHVVVIAKEEYQKDEHTGMMQFGPMFPGQKLGPQMPYFFDEVFRYVVVTDPITKQSWSGLQTTADTQSVAKDRSGALDPIEYPHLGQIFAKISTGRPR